MSRYLTIGLLLAATAAADAVADLAPSVVDVRTVGAVGDGVTDDSAALRSALARVPPAGGSLWIPAGAYLLAQGLAVDRGNIAIICDVGATLVVGGPGVKLIQVHGDKTPEGRARNVRIEGCRFLDPDPEANVALEESHGIVLNRVDGAILRHLDFENMGDESVDIIQSTDVRLLDSRAVGGCAAIAHPHAGSFSVNSSSRVQIRGNLIERNANGAAIRVEVNPGGTRSDYVIVADNQIFDAEDRARLGRMSGSGIVVIPGKNSASVITISANQVVNPHRFGILVHPAGTATASALVIQGNSVVGGGAGIADLPNPNYGAIAVVGRASVGTVVGNVVRNWGADGMAHAGLRITGDRLAVLGNAIDGIAGPGIDQDTLQGQGNAIIGNLLIGTTGLTFDPGNVTGLNKTDADGNVRLGDLRDCSVLGMSPEGNLVCAH